MKLAVSQTRDSKLPRLARYVVGCWCLMLVLACQAQSQMNKGSILLVGDVLSYAERDVWKGIFEIAGGEDADVVVIAAAHERAKLYGNYAFRALDRYGVFVDLLPLAIDVDEFGTDFRKLVYDPEIINLIDQAQVVFFVNGAPQRLEMLLFNDDGSATPLSSAIERHYAGGGVVVSGINGSGGAHTDLDALTILQRGYLLDTELYRGLNLMPSRWGVDQHFFSPGRIAETLVAMHQLDIDYAIGVGPGATALVEQGQLSVSGDAGVVVIDLSEAVSSAETEAFNLTKASLIYLEDEDQLDLLTLTLRPSAARLDGFVIEPGVNSASLSISRSASSIDMFDAGRLRALMIDALESDNRQSIGLMQAEQSTGHQQSFSFRFYSGEETQGWMDVETGHERYTIRNMYLDVIPSD